ERVDAGVGLDRPGEVADVEEDRLAVAALAGQAPGDPVGEFAMLPLAELLGVVRLEDCGDPVAVREGEGVGIDAFGPQPLDLRQALGSGGAGRGLYAGGRVSHRPTVLGDRTDSRSRRDADSYPLTTHVVAHGSRVAQHLPHRRPVVRVVLHRQPPAARRFGDQAADHAEAVLAAGAGDGDPRLATDLRRAVIDR